MVKLIYDLYKVFFARKLFYKFNKLLYGMSLRGLGILNYGTDKQSGEAHFIVHYFSSIKEGIIFDVGANIGTYSKRIHQLNECIEIFAFEPHPTTYQRLINNVKGTGIRTYNVGIGKSEGILKLYDYADDDGSEHASLYRDVIEKIHQGESIAHEIKMISLSVFANEQNIQHIRLLKIDTEGHELEVLRGFEEYIRTNKVDAIHFEFNEMNIASRVYFKDFWDMLPNYDFFRMLPDGLVKIKHYSPVFCEIYAYQNIVALLKVKFRQDKNLSNWG